MLCFSSLGPPPACCYSMGVGITFSSSLDFHLPSAPFVPYCLTTVLFWHSSYISSCPFERFNSVSRALICVCMWRESTSPFRALPDCEQSKACANIRSCPRCFCFFIVSMDSHVCCEHRFCLLVPLVRVLVCEP